jgi:hypothetical protein
MISREREKHPDYFKQHYAAFSLLLPVSSCSLS